MEDKFPGLLTDYEMFRLVVKFLGILSAGLEVVDITIKCDKVLVPKILQYILNAGTRHIA